MGQRPRLESPLVGALINVGDSVLVSVQLHDNKQLKNATMLGVTERGSTDLGTYTQTPRYKTVSIPAAGGFRSGLRDTTIRRYLQPLNAADTSLDSVRVIVIATNEAGGADTVTRRIDIVAGPKVTRRGADQRRQHSRRRRPQRLGACSASERRRPHRHSRPG